MFFSNRTYTDTKSTGKKKVLQSEMPLEKFSDLHEKPEIFHFSWIVFKFLVRQALRFSRVALKKSLEVKKVFFCKLP